MADPKEIRQPEIVTLMYVPGPLGSIRRFNLRRVWITRGACLVVATLAAMTLLTVDYVRLRRSLGELDHLRAQTTDQRERIDEYAQLMETISGKLQQISHLDRKLRVITNLDPADELPLPGIGGIEGELFEPEIALGSGARHQKIVESLGVLNEAADAQRESLNALIAHLEDQSARLVRTPSIAPSRGWVTSPFGYRTSPFTGNRQFHRGIDIAGRLGTPILAPADGEVRFVGSQRALGKTLILEHGYGVETVYGHLSEVLVERGQKVKRGERVALMGTTGRSTGPHLHYQVEVSGVPKNPQNYILD